MQVLTSRQQVEDRPTPRMKVLLANGGELIIDGAAYKPRWYFTTKSRTDPNTPVPSCLGATYEVDDKFVRRDKDGIQYKLNEESLQFVNLLSCNT